MTTSTNPEIDPPNINEFYTDLGLTDEERKVRRQMMKLYNLTHAIVTIAEGHVAVFVEAVFDYLRAVLKGALAV